MTSSWLQEIFGNARIFENYREITVHLIILSCIPGVV